ncbi:MAG: TetR/AcrR family transcriptional regulator [Lachnospiraceae bacterium]|nr:TetR/AcrR family transcriptional regulator [Lachnospiraceae bacterium]
MDNRQAILDSALTLFYEKGYDAVGVQQIVDAAGVTKPTLYYYFGSKQGLLSCLLEEHFSKLETQMEQVKDAPEKIQDKLYHTARIFLNGASAEPEFYLMMLALFYSGRKSEGFQTVYPLIERYYQIFVEIFEHASQELGNMRGRQRQFAVGFSGMLNHYLMFAAKDMDDLSNLTITDQEVYEIVHQFMYGIYS